MDKTTKIKEWVSSHTDTEDRYDLIFTTQYATDGEKLATIYRKNDVINPDFNRNTSPFYFTSEFLGVENEELLSGDDVMDLICSDPRTDLVLEAKWEVEDKIQELYEGFVFKYSELLRLFKYGK